MVPEESDAIIQMLFIRSGRLIGSEHYVLEGGGSEAPGEVILQFILQYYDAENMPPQELLLSAEPPERDVLEQLLSELHGRRTYILTPLRGEKRKLVAMAQKNARDEAEKRRKKALPQPRAHRGRGAGIAARAGPCRLPAPHRGLRHLQHAGRALRGLHGGDDRRRLPRARSTRHFRIKTVVGANDFASMHEVITRRLSHGLPRAGGQIRGNARSHPSSTAAAASSPRRRTPCTPSALTSPCSASPSALRRSCCRTAKKACCSTAPARRCT